MVRAVLWDICGLIVGGFASRLHSICARLVKGGTLNDVAKKLILRTAFRYLREGGILAEGNDSESLVARFT